MAKYIIEINDKELGNTTINGYPTIVGIFDDKVESKLLTPYEEPEQEKPKRWRAEKGENYWSIDSCGETINHADNYWLGDKWRYESGNYFKTQEEAEDYRESLIVYNELKAYAEPDDAVWDGSHGHYYIVYNTDNNELTTDGRTVVKACRLYFASREATQAAIEAVGEDRVKRYYLGIKED